MWIGKPKLMPRVLWYQGWIDTSKLYDYTISGKKYEKVTVIQEIYLLQLIDQCRYFSEEDTQLQYI